MRMIDYYKLIILTIRKMSSLLMCLIDYPSFTP